MSTALDRKEASDTSIVPMLPHVHELTTKLPNNNHEKTTESTLHPDVDPPVSSESEHVTAQQPNGAAEPSHCDSIRTHRSFRLSRFSAGRAVADGSVSSIFLVQNVYDAIMKEVPDALVAHVHDGRTISRSNVASIDSPRDFKKGFTNAGPSFILVDGCQQHASLAVEMLWNHARRTDGAVVVVFLEHAADVDLKRLIEKVPVLIAAGADDVIMIPRDATNVRLSIAVSLAKAQASQEQKIKRKRQIHALINQCHDLFWVIAHEIIRAFPKFQRQLREIPEKLVGDRVLVRRLGQGTHGSVYRWEDHGRQCIGAVKVFPKNMISSAYMAGQIAKEIAMLRRLNHQNVVAFERAMHGSQSVYLFMEMAGTKTLRQLIGGVEGAKGLSWPWAEAIVSQIATGVAYCHSMAVAHCDLKPENIVISVSHCAKIVDFGEAVDLRTEVAPLKGPKGTMPFVAPEIMLCCADWDPAAADIWAFGVILVEILCGINAFVHLLGWEGKFLTNVAELAERAAELLTFFAKDVESANSHALVALSDLFCDLPPPFLIPLLGHMFEIMPDKRIVAESIVQCLQNLP